VLDLCLLSRTVNVLYRENAYCCRLEIEAEPWMEGVLDVLMGIVGGSAAEDNSATTVNCLPSTQATAIVEQSATAHTVTSVQDDELTGKVIQSDLESDIGLNEKTVGNLSDHVMSVEFHSTVPSNASSMDVNSTVTDSHRSRPEPESSVPLLSNDIILESSLVNNAVVTETEDTDASVITEESITHSLPPLSALSLTIPLCPPRYLKLSFLPDEKLVSRFYIFTIVTLKFSFQTLS